MEPRLNPRGPSRKAKYSLTTDSGLSRVTERWEEPLLGEDTEPETMCLQAVGALWHCLLPLPGSICFGGSVGVDGQAPSGDLGNATCDGVPFA